MSSTGNRASPLARLSDLLLTLGRRWWAIFRLVPMAGPALVALAVVGNLLLGLLPIAFLIGTSTLISRVESDVGAHRGALWAPVVPALVLAGAALVVQNLLTPFQGIVGELVMRRIDGRCIRGLIRSSLQDASMCALEEPEVLSDLNDARAGLTQGWQTPGSAVVGLLALITRYTQMLGAAAVIAVVLGPVAGAAVAASVYIARVGWRYALTGFVLFSETQGGQWQLLALARGLMREGPLLLVLDEPAAALDAAAEHALFERYASSARVVARDLGSVTVLISHRFSTVLMAGTIAVLDHGRIVEHGSHAQLMASHGLYAELFGMQARAYR